MIKSARVLIVIELLFAGVPQLAQAYVDMIRYGHNRCNSCHISPGGDGPLTPYGRALSEEVLNQWPAAETDVNNLFASTESSPWLASGDVRFLSYYFQNEKAQSFKAGPMQLEGELAWRSPKLIIDVSLGYEVASFSSLDRERTVSRRHYVLYMPKEQTWGLRFGRFAAQFGLFLEDHTSVTRNPLSLGINQESYNLEFSYLTANQTFFLTYQGPNPDKADYDQDVGTVAALRWHAWPGQEVGISALKTSSNNRDHVVAGSHWFWTLHPRWISYFEWDYEMETKKSLATERVGWTFLARSEYTIGRGLYASLGFEARQDDISSSSTKKDYGRVELRWFPRPHWELGAVYKQLRTPAIAKDFSEISYFTLHYYF